jgi:hypothetical protein
MNGHLLFRIFYTTFFTILNIVLLALLLITPADAIRQALNNDQLYNVFVIAGCYLLTVLLAILIYASRLYTNKSVLQGIPKTWIPIEKGEVSKSVRKMIEAGLRRSAAIAWDSRPRIAPQPTTIVNEPDARDVVVRMAEAEPDTAKKGKKRDRILLQKQIIDTDKDEHTVAIPPHLPVWGDIAHNGWSSPTSPDLPNLQYTTVILELPHLIEARAVSMAPSDPESTTNPPMPHLRAVDLLQRPAAMGLRDYIGHLTSIGALTSPTTDFLEGYEQARFAPQPLSEPEFRHLMAQFADLLRNIQPLNPVILASLDIDPPESDIDDDVSSTSTPRSRSLASVRTPSSRSGSEGTIRTAPSRRVGTGSSPTKRTEFSTAPATPRSRKSKKSQNKPVVSRSSSMNSFAQSRRPYDGSSAGSSESLRSESGGSVIRLSSTNESGELPYTLTIPGADRCVHFYCFLARSWRVDTIGLEFGWDSLMSNDNVEFISFPTLRRYKALCLLSCTAGSSRRGDDGLVEGSEVRFCEDCFCWYFS